jgi:hypothetical protein
VNVQGLADFLAGLTVQGGVADAADKGLQTASGAGVLDVDALETTFFQPDDGFLGVYTKTDVQPNQYYFVAKINGAWYAALLGTVPPSP